jgi:hypothetical protein
MVGPTSLPLRVLALSAALILLTGAVGAEPPSIPEPPNFPEPFGSLVTPHRVNDLLAPTPAPTQPGAPLAASVAAVRLGASLAITVVGWLPDGAKDAALLYEHRAGASAFVLHPRTREPSRTAAPTPFGKTFLFDLQEAGNQALRHRPTVEVALPGGGLRSVAVQELPLAPQG